MQNFNLRIAKMSGYSRKSGTSENLCIKIEVNEEILFRCVFGHHRCGQRGLFRPSRPAATPLLPSGFRRPVLRSLIQRFSGFLSSAADRLSDPGVTLRDHVRVGPVPLLPRNAPRTRPGGRRTPPGGSLLPLNLTGMTVNR